MMAVILKSSIVSSQAEQYISSKVTVKDQVGIEQMPLDVSNACMLENSKQ